MWAHAPPPLKGDQIWARHVGAANSSGSGDEIVTGTLVSTWSCLLLGDAECSSLNGSHELMLARRSEVCCVHTVRHSCTLKHMQMWWRWGHHSHKTDSIQGLSIGLDPLNSPQNGFKKRVSLVQSLLGRIFIIDLYFCFIQIFIIYTVPIAKLRSFAFKIRNWQLNCRLMMRVSSSYFSLYSFYRSILESAFFLSINLRHL